MISQGYVICLVLVVPLSLYNLEENVPVQIVTTIFCLGCIVLWLFDILWLSRDDTTGTGFGGLAGVGE